MNIPTAIETLTKLKRYSYPTIEKEAQDSLQLGIEALRREQEYRLTRGERTFDLLPGETEE